MVVDIKMCRFDNVPWGFRLVGGSDCEVPLTVVKVTEGSIAEEAGLRVNDIIVRINDDAASPMTHDEVHRVITHCGNVFFLGIQRENEEEEKVRLFPIENKNVEPVPILSPVDDLYGEELTVDEEIESKVEDQEIASLLSSEAEVLKDHNVIGIFPKPGVCQSSEVLRELNKESIKTKQEKEEEKKKWTTFLQKPNRPIPKSKQQLEAEARASNAYRVNIVKNYKKPEPVVRPPSPTPEPELQLKAEEPPKDLTPPPEEDELPPTDSEVPNLEQIEEETIEEADPQKRSGDEVVKTDVDNEEVNESTNDESSNTNEQKESSVEKGEKPPSESGSVREKTEEELQLEQQLADVQRQLLALSTLPSTIQSTLDAVTKQLSDMLPMFKLQSSTTAEPVHDIQTETVEERDNEEDNFEEVNVTDLENRPSDRVDERAELTTPTENDTPCPDQGEIEVVDQSELAEQHIERTPTNERHLEEEQMEEEQNLKRKKDTDVIEELQKHMEAKETQKRKRSKRLFGPLVPQERPLILPGGRRWYRPKDAYNDEFIAETLTAQAELIAGTAIGLISGIDSFKTETIHASHSENNCASVIQQLERRVNFMKYQKPEKKINLDKSEVYKVIHRLDKSPIRGIEVRPPIVIAAVDVKTNIE